MDHFHKTRLAAANEVASGGPPSVVNVYGTDFGSLAYDRVVSQQFGGVNHTGVPAGGTITWDYAQAPGGPASMTPWPRPPSPTATATSPATTSTAWGNVVARQEQTNRDVRESDPGTFTSRFEYNADSELVQIAFPQGNVVALTYDTGNPDRLQQGNLLSMTAIADADRGGDQETITTTYTFEPIYNRVRTMTEARGNDPGYFRQNSGANSPARHTTTYTSDYEESLDLEALGANTGRTAGEIGALLSGAGMGASPLGEVNGDGHPNINPPDL